MGQRTRHFIALSKKNWIVWKRRLMGSLCELSCPIVLMAILVLARYLIDATVNDPTSNMSKSILFAPLIQPSAVNFAGVTNVTQAGAAYFAAYDSQYGGLANFSQTQNTSLYPIFQLVPVQCMKQTAGDAGLPVIAIAGPSQYTGPIARDLGYLIAFQQNLTKIQQGAPKTMTQKVLQSFNVNLYVKIFNSSQEILDYLSSPDYNQNNGKDGLCFGFSIEEDTPDNVNVKLIFSGQFQDKQTQSIPSQLNPVWDEYSINADFTSFQRYANQGYSMMHNWIANSILKVKSNNVNAHIAMALVPFKTDTYISDDFLMIMSGMLPFFMLLIYILPMYRLISSIVSEKESKARESMKMMGLNDFSYWLSWWVYYMVITTIISGLCIGVLSINVLKYSNRGLVFLIFWVYGLSLFGLAVFLSSFFSRARVAAIAGTLVYFGTSFINVAVGDQSVGTRPKNLATLLTTVGVARASNNLAQFETSGVGVQISNMSSYYQNYALSESLGIMVISLILFFLAGIYLDNVLPSAYGLQKHWYYFLTPSYWCGWGKIKASQLNKNSINAATVDPENDGDAFFECKNMNKANFEPVSRDLLKQEQDNKILKIKDLQKTFDNGFKAVNGINVKMYTGQIFALLGHNGAGKTTLISMLTGLINSSGGIAEVFGTEIFEDMNTVRQFMGVCPQHDILFDQLTPEEHLDIFCEFKGVDRKDKDEQIKKMIQDVDLYAHRDTVAENLSGGSRRKLSVAIALIGGSKLVLLDEPTAGLDLTARRKLWNMLKNYKHNRIIILTTHYMDEADILGDRIGIMTAGQLICLGSSLFLKNRFGVGYNLTMVKKEKENDKLIGPYLKKFLGSDVKMLSEVSSEITYQIPTALSSMFKDFFTQFDQTLDSLGIRSYGISVTTLEEVFLKVGHGDTDNEDHKLKESLKQITAEGKSLLGKTQEEDEFSISDPKYHLSGLSGFYQHLKALFLKRFYIYRRNRRGLVIEVLIPVLLVLIGFAFSKVQFFNPQPDRLLVPSLYPLKQRILVNQDPIIFSKTASQNIAPSSIFESLPMYNSSFSLKSMSYPQFTNLSDSAKKTGQMFDNDTFDNRLADSYSPYRFGSFFIYEANNQSKQFKAAVFINLTSQDVTPLYPQFLYQAILSKALGKPNFNFTVTTVSYPITQKLRQRAATASGIFIAFVVSIGFALIPAVVVSFILNERENNLKHMQLISGMSLTAYWISNMIFDIIKGIIPSVIVIGLIYAFKLDLPNVWLLFLLYPVGVIPFTYVSSFLFTTENLAQTITIFLHFVFAGIGAIVVFILRVIPSTFAVGDALMWVFKLVPSYCLTEAIMVESSKARLFLIRPELYRSSDFDITIIGGNVLVLCLHFLFWSLLLILIEYGAFSWVNNLISVMGKNKIPAKDDAALALDEDVIEEDKRVEATNSSDMKVRVHRFRKIYPSLFRKPILAVERTSFGLDYGECFALLGINGAGKSTTFKALTCEIEPSAGQITINGFNVQKDFNEARKLIGYCPQHDAIFELMTVEEHLQYYARIKGIPENIRMRIIERQIEDMNLQEHRTKPAGTLSGGNKRKLSVAMAIIGNPPIILLDEPSAGMDPQARRFMWQIVSRISQQRKQSAVILTTHSMEEAEALSTKMGIMVKGGVFRCFGSSQHIKNKYGTGYEIEIKVRKITNEALMQMASTYNIAKTESLSLNELIQIMTDLKVDPKLIAEVRIDGLGEDLVKESLENEDSNVSISNFLLWLYIEQAGMAIVKQLVEQFESVEILEHYNDYFKLRVPRGDKSIGFVFGMIEGRKEEFKISEYSVSQTTLEQIFQTFANMKIDDDSKTKQIFYKDNAAAKNKSQEW